MAEAHPVGFRWAMKARERGAKLIHVDPRFGRTSALADLLRPDPRRDRHRVRRRADQPRARRPRRTSRSTCTRTRTRRPSSTRTSRTPRTSAAGSAASTPSTATTTRSTWGYEGGEVAAAAGQREHSTQSFEARTGAGMLTGEVERDETLQHPRCVINVLKRHFSRYTPEMVERICGITPAAVRRGGDAADRELRARADVRAVLRRRLDAAHLGRADDPRGGDPAAAAGQHRPPGRRHPRAARARVDPGLDRHPDALRPAARLPAHAARARAGARPRDLLRERRLRSAAGGRTSPSTPSRC